MTRRRQLVSQPAHNRPNAGSIPAAATILLLVATVAHGQTWLRDVDVAPEVECASYDRASWGFDARRHRQDLADGLDVAPYSGEAIPAVPSGRDWHVEHVTSLKEAAESGLCDSPDRWREFANDRRNLTLSQARTNIQKGARDAAEWLPATPEGRCFLVRTVLTVKDAYNLTIDQAEADALEGVLLDGDCGSGHDDYMAYFDLIEIPSGWQRWRLDWRRWEYDRRQERREAALAELRASQEPPARVWRIGNLLFWTAPSSGPMPRGYRVEEGNTVSHPWHPHENGRAVYEHVLRTAAPARIEAEHGGGLSHRVYSPFVAAGPEPSVLVQRVRYYASRTWRSNKSRDRWRRVLQGIGVPCGVGHAGRPPECGIEPAMTAAEAQGYHDRGWSPWWGHVAGVLRRLEQSGTCCP